MGRTVYLPQKEITEAHHAAIRARDRAHAAFTAHQAETAKLKDPARHAELRQLNAQEIFDRKLAAMNRAEMILAEAAGDGEATKKRLGGLARSLEMSHAMGAARFLPKLSAGTAAEHESNLVAERAQRLNERERLATLRSEADIRDELDRIKASAKQDGIANSPALATLHELKAHARAAKMPMTTMAAISATESHLAEYWGERGELVDRVQEAASAYDTINELRRAIRMPPSPAANMFLQAAKKTA